MKKILTFILLLLTLRALAQKNIYVNALQQSSPQTGMDWAHAYTDLQAALAASASKDTIWVAKGTYTPTSGTDRSISFELKNGVLLYGGFAGVENLLEQRDPSLNPTVLSGDIGLLGHSKDNVYHVLRGRGLGPNTRFDGFVVRDGYSDLNVISALDGTGGGMLLEGTWDMPNAQPLIANCIFERNHAYLGGGMGTTWTNPDEPVQTQYLVNPRLKNCIFRNNKADFSGGGLYANSATGQGDSLVLESCLFIENTVDYWAGGGICFNQTAWSNLRLSNCVFERDSAKNGGIAGAIYLEPTGPDSNQASLHLDACRFSNNVAAGNACILYYGAFAPLSKKLGFEFRVSECVFEGNKAIQSDGSTYEIVASNGGHVNALIRNTRFVDNISKINTTNIGPGLGSTAEVLYDNCVFLNNNDDLNGVCVAINVSTSTDPNNINTIKSKINNCVFARNGGGISSLGGSNNRVQCNITNCTFFENRDYVFAKDWYQEHVLDTSYFNRMIIDNCVVWEQTPNAQTMFYTNDMGLSAYKGYTFRNSSVNLPPSISFYPWFTTENVIYLTYPEFRDTLLNDFSLLPCSPMVNKGNTALVAGFATDLNGNPRVFEGQVDMGAFESQDSCLDVGSVEAYISPTFDIAPNPVACGDLLHLSMENMASVERLNVYVMDVQGRVIKAEHGLQPDTRLEMYAPMDPGFYVVGVQWSSGSLIRKIIVLK